MVVEAVVVEPTDDTESDWYFPISTSPSSSSLSLSLSSTSILFDFVEASGTRITGTVAVDVDGVTSNVCFVAVVSSKFGSIVLLLLILMLFVNTVVEESEEIGKEEGGIGGGGGGCCCLVKTTSFELVFV